MTLGTVELCERTGADCLEHTVLVTLGTVELFERTGAEWLEQTVLVTLGTAELFEHTVADLGLQGDTVEERNSKLADAVEES